MLTTQSNMITSLKVILLTSLTSAVAATLISISGTQAVANPSISQRPQTPSTGQTQLDNFVKQGVQGEAEAPSAAERRAAPATKGHRALQRALSQLGYREKPFGSNCQKYSRYFGKGCQSWCADFVSYVFDRNGDRKLPWSNVSTVQSILDWGKAKGRLVTRPRPGDIFLLKGDGQSHTGIVRSVSGRSYTTVEGNAKNAVRSYRRTINNNTYFVRMPN